MSEWQGEDRRKTDGSHDLLIETNTIVKGIAKTMETHVANDREDFNSVHRRINRTNWYVAIGLGVVSAIEIFKDKIFK